jgi:hypothetical protein
MSIRRSRHIVNSREERLHIWPVLLCREKFVCTCLERMIIRACTCRDAGYRDVRREAEICRLGVSGRMRPLVVVLVGVLNPGCLKLLVAGCSANYPFLHHKHLASSSYRVSEMEMVVFTGVLMLWHPVESSECSCSFVSVARLLWIM